MDTNNKSCPGIYDNNHCIWCKDLWICKNFKVKDFLLGHKNTTLENVIYWIKNKVSIIIITIWLASWLLIDKITDIVTSRYELLLNTWVTSPENDKKINELHYLENLLHITIRWLITILTSLIIYITWLKEQEINNSKEKSEKLEVILFKLIKILNELKEKEKQLNEALENIANANNAKWIFLANLAHELRNPLNVISWYWQMFLSWLLCEMNERSTWAVSTIIAASDNLLSLINDILDSTKAESWKTTLNKEKWNISKVLKDVLQILIIEFDLKNIKLILSADKNIELNFDDIKIKRVLINIIWNAVKFTKNNWNINIALTENEWIVSIVVTDDWMWIKWEDLDKLCTPFVQWDHSIKWTWLWLHISKQIIEDHSWTFQIESEWEWKWTTVTITLPKN